MVAHAVNVPLSVVEGRLSDYDEAVKTHAGRQHGFPPERSTTEMMYAVSRLQELSRAAGHPLYMCFIDFLKAHDSADRTRLCQVLGRCGVLSKMALTIRQFHDCMGACTRLDHGGCSEQFKGKYGLQHGCVLLPQPVTT